MITLQSYETAPKAASVRIDGGIIIDELLATRHPPAVDSKILHYF